MQSRIKEIRKANGLTQAEFAERLGVSVNNIINYENGRRSPSAAGIQNIVRTFNINETWLLTGEGEMTSPITREQEIASVTAQMFQDGEDSFRYKLIKLVSQMAPEQIKACQEFIKKLSEE